MDRCPTPIEMAFSTFFHTPWCDITVCLCSHHPLGCHKAELALGQDLCSFRNGIFLAGWPKPNKLLPNISQHLPTSLHSWISFTWIKPHWRSFQLNERSETGKMDRCLADLVLIMRDCGAKGLQSKIFIKPMCSVLHVLQVNESFGATN